MDKKAVSILMNTFWSSEGWKPKRVISDEDIEYLSKHGMWFQPQNYDHDIAQNELISLIKQVNRKVFTGNFLSSLSTRELCLRSALGSYATHCHLYKHPHTDAVHCQICGTVKNNTKEDWNIYNFERIKWGGVRHPYLAYAFFDLQTSAEYKETPTKDDIKLFKEIIQTLKNLPAEEKIRDAEKSLQSIVKSNKAEREILLQILGYCGILQPKNKKSFLKSFVAYSDRDIPAVNKIDWTFPVCWWHGSDGINSEALNFYFGEYVGKIV